MRSYVLDASALLAFLEGAPFANKVAEILKQAHERRASLAMSVVNWGEVYYTISRKRSPKEAESTRQVVSHLPLEMVSVDLAEAETAARLKLRYRLPYADGFAASLSLARKATLLTGDRDFKRMGTAVKVMWITKQ